MITKLDYKINYQALNLGHSYYDYDIDDTFIHYYNPNFDEMRDVFIHIKIDLLKTETCAELFINLKGSYNVLCDRCLSFMKIDIDKNDYLIFKEGIGEDDETIIYISQGTEFIDLRPHIYDFIALSMPMRHVHNDESDCDQEMLNKLKEYLIEDY